MRSKLLADLQALKTWVIVLETGEEAMAVLTTFATDQSIKSAYFTAIGAFSRATLGYFDWETKQYDRIPIEAQVEVVSLTGDIALEKDRPKIHAHATLGQRGGVTVGGHFLEGYVRPTLEIVLSESPKHLERRFDAQSGIALIRIDGSN